MVPTFLEASYYPLSGLPLKDCCSLGQGRREEGDCGFLPSIPWGAVAGLAMDTRGAASKAVPQCLVFSWVNPLSPGVTQSNAQSLVLAAVPGVGGH